MLEVLKKKKTLSNLKKHTKIYLKALGYDTTDFIPSELSGQRGVDLHHIVNRENRIENLMCLTRDEHIENGEIKDRMVFLLKRHRDFLSENGVKFCNKWFNEKINFYQSQYG